jgi:hypothetical protein
MSGRSSAWSASRQAGGDVPLQHLGFVDLPEVFDTAPLRRHETVATEAGAHTLSFDAARNILGAFLPGSHRAAVYRDQE